MMSGLLEAGTPDISQSKLAGQRVTDALVRGVPVFPGVGGTVDRDSLRGDRDLSRIVDHNTGP